MPDRKLGRHMGKSPVLERLAIDKYLTGQVDPFPYSDPKSTFDGTTGGATTGMLGTGPTRPCPALPAPATAFLGPHR